MTEESWGLVHLRLHSTSRTLFQSRDAGHADRCGGHHGSFTDEHVEIDSRSLSHLATASAGSKPEWAAVSRKEPIPHKFIRFERTELVKRASNSTGDNRRILRIPVPVLPQGRPDSQENHRGLQRIRWRIVWKHYPLSSHQNALDAALAAEAARNQNKFWEYHDRLFANQKRLDVESLRQYTRELELNLDRFEKDRLHPDTRKKVEADVAEAEALRVSATPSFSSTAAFLGRPTVRGSGKDHRRGAHQTEPSRSAKDSAD